MRLETNVQNIEKRIDEHTKEQREDFNKVFSLMRNLDDKFDESFNNMKDSFDKRYAYKSRVDKLEKYIGERKNQRFQMKVSIISAAIAGTAAIIATLITLL